MEKSSQKSLGLEDGLMNQFTSTLLKPPPPTVPWLTKVLLPPHPENASTLHGIIEAGWHFKEDFSTYAEKTKSK